jgi:hypothetical protein
VAEAPSNPIETSISEALQKQLPVNDLPGISIRDVRSRPEEPFDISFDLISGSNRVRVLGEVKRTFTPSLLQQIAPWIERLKSLRPDVAIAVISPMFSQQAQAYCVQNRLNFLDLAGNIYIDVPGKLTVQRTGRRTKGVSAQELDGPRSLNVFSGRTSRILRVLLESSKSWTLSDIARELDAETNRFRTIFPAAEIDFQVSLGSISKALASLEDQLWIRRRGTSLVLPEPQRLLQQWAEKYRERYRWRLRRSFQANNPFGRDLTQINQALQSLITAPYVFSGAMAAADAPFVDIDQAEVFLLADSDDRKLRELRNEPNAGPKFRFIYPYDEGVFMYSRRPAKAPLASPIQTYLDLFARGGRDFKQAEYLLANFIQPRWGAA